MQKNIQKSHSSRLYWALFVDHLEKQTQLSGNRRGEPPSYESKGGDCEKQTQSHPKGVDSHPQPEIAMAFRASQ
jgi:hypothetical protein